MNGEPRNDFIERDGHINHIDSPEYYDCRTVDYDDLAKKGYRACKLFTLYEPITRKQCKMYNNHAVALIDSGHQVVTFSYSRTVVTMMVKPRYIKETLDAIFTFLLCCRGRQGEPRIPIVKDVAVMIAKMVFKTACDPEVWHPKDPLEQDIDQALDEVCADDANKNKRQKRGE